MNQSHTMTSNMYNNEAEYVVRDATPQRRRRSQPSLEVRPYPRPSLSHSMPGHHMNGDEGHSPSYIHVKMEPQHSHHHHHAGSPHSHSDIHVKMEPHSAHQHNTGFLAYASPYPSPMEQTPPNSAHNSYYPPTTLPYEPVNSNMNAYILRPAADFSPVPLSMADAGMTFDRYDSNFLPLTAYHGGNGSLVALAPDNTQLPSNAEFDAILNEYINDLSPKKQDKALIPQKRLNNIEAVLRDPKCTTIESAQFRFWAKKMFTLQTDENGNEKVMHENKPVAVREKLYRILTTAHILAQHGGRDKTSSQVRKQYSWVPKELIARFVRNCPNCRARRCPVLSTPVSSRQFRQRTTPPLPTLPTIPQRQQPLQTPMGTPLTNHSHISVSQGMPTQHFAAYSTEHMQQPSPQFTQWAQ